MLTGPSCLKCWCFRTLKVRIWGGPPCLFFAGGKVEMWNWFWKHAGQRLWAAHRWHGEGWGVGLLQPDTKLISHGKLMDLVEFEFYHIWSKILVFVHVHLFSWSIYTLTFLCWIVIGMLVHLFCSQRNGGICHSFHMCSDCRKPVNSGWSVWMLLQDKVAKLM